MGAPCMPVRPTCIVLGVESHCGIGLTPVGVPAPAAITFWISVGTTYETSAGDPPVPNVIICGEKAVQKGADTKFFRSHFSTYNVLPPPPAVTVPPVMDLGLVVLNILVGCTKPIWGPTGVWAGNKSLAVMRAPNDANSAFNQLICSDPCDLPLGFGGQSPSTVFAGMDPSDYGKCLISLAIDMAWSFAINWMAGEGSPTAPFVKLATKQTAKEVAKDVVKYGWEKFARSAAGEAAKKIFGPWADVDPDKQLGFKPPDGPKGSWK